VLRATAPGAQGGGDFAEVMRPSFAAVLMAGCGEGGGDDDLIWCCQNNKEREVSIMKRIDEHQLNVLNTTYRDSKTAKVILSRLSRKNEERSFQPFARHKGGSAWRGGLQVWLSARSTWHTPALAPAHAHVRTRIDK